MHLASVLVWIEGTFPAQFVARPFIYPVVSAFHLFGIAILFGSIVPVDLRLMRTLGSQFDAALPSLVRIALLGFALAASSGVLLASVRIVDYSQNPAFLAKMLIVLAAGMNALLLRVRSGPAQLASSLAQRNNRIAALVSLLLWISAVFAGRWIAFV